MRGFALAPLEFGTVSRLIVISNRVSAPKARSADGTQGGLAVALAAALREARGIWFGWSGNKTDEFTGQINLSRDEGVTSATIDLEEQDVDEYYNGYANRTLWPLFHYRIDLAEYDRSFGAGYERVNDRFAETVAPLIEPDDLVWVHDYHLIPLGQRLRQHKVANRIGFFLHIPWPPHRLMVSLPYHQRLVRSMLAYDLIGFQSEEWLESFHHYIERELGGTVEPDGTIVVGERRVKTAVFPIGIDVAEFENVLARKDARNAFETLRTSAEGKKVVIGVDRLDYSKGLTERFLGYQRFLEENPDWHGKTFLLQIAPPSRGEVHTYENIRAELDELSGRINGEFAHVDWVPIRYVNRGYPRDGLSGFYRAAACRADHAAARRHEPRRQGICRVAGSGRSRRSHPVALRRRRAPDARGPAGQSVQQGRRQRRHPRSARHAQGRTPAPLGSADRRRSHRRCHGLAPRIRRCAPERVPCRQDRSGYHPRLSITRSAARGSGSTGRYGSHDRRR